VFITENNKGNGNGSSDYQPSKTFQHIFEDTWLEDDEEEPGKEKLVDSDNLRSDLGDDDDPETRNLKNRN
jgi:hypothetical protein